MQITKADSISSTASIPIPLSVSFPGIWSDRVLALPINANMVPGIYLLTSEIEYRNSVDLFGGEYPLFASISSQTNDLIRKK